MNQKFERIARHLYQRKYRTAPGDWTTLYCAHFVCRLKVKSRVIPLGSDESLAKDELKKIEARDVDRHDFDLDRERNAMGNRNRLPCWMGGQIPDVWRHEAEKIASDRPFAHQECCWRKSAGKLLPDTSMRRWQAPSFECEKKSKKAVSRSTVSNELSLFRHILRLAARVDYKVLVPSFEALVVRTERGGRALTEDEEKKLLVVYPPWMRRLAEFADETCLSQGDLLRVTEDG
jgi:hypothetical protein